MGKILHYRLDNQKWQFYSGRFEIKLAGSTELAKIREEPTNVEPASNQIYLVTFMCLTVDISFIFTKNQMLQNGFLISVMLRLAI